MHYCLYRLFYSLAKMCRLFIHNKSVTFFLTFFSFRKFIEILPHVRPYPHLRPYSFIYTGTHIYVYTFIIIVMVYIIDNQVVVVVVAAVVCLPERLCFFIVCVRSLQFNFISSHFIVKFCRKFFSNSLYKHSLIKCIR